MYVILLYYSTHAVIHEIIYLDIQLTVVKNLLYDSMGRVVK